VKRFIPFLTLLLLSVVFIPTGIAHVPLAPHDNTSIESAFHIHEPTKSWAIYDEIHESHEAKYYTLEMHRGERLHISIFTPEESDFSPRLVIMSENYDSNTSLPDYIERPVGYGVIIIEGKRPAEADYEPFTPTSYYNILEFDEDVNETAIYYLAIFEPENTGKFGLAVGHIESFDVDEWISVPIDVVNIHLWEGQKIIFILAPVIISLIVGLGLTFWPKFTLISPPEITGIFFPIGGFLYIGSGVSVFTQMAVALTRAPVGAGVTVTSIFVTIPILLGLGVMRITNTKKDFKRNDTIKIGGLGVLGLIFWAGLIVGPIIIISGLIIILLRSYFFDNNNK